MSFKLRLFFKCTTYFQCVLIFLKKAAWKLRYLSIMILTVFLITLIILIYVFIVILRCDTNRLQMLRKLCTFLNKISFLWRSFDRIHSCYNKVASKERLDDDEEEGHSRTRYFCRNPIQLWDYWRWHFPNVHLKENLWNTFI